MNRLMKLSGMVFAVAALSGAVLGANLLVNPGAETGNTSGWVDEDEAWGARTDNPQEGARCFWPWRQHIPYTTLFQDVDVSDQGAAIDGGEVYAHLQGWLRNWDQYPHDQSTLAIQPMNISFQQLGYAARHHRSPVWTRYTIDMPLPPGTRVVRVLLIATRYVGADNDGYFDNLSLEVDSIAPAISVTVTSTNELTRVRVGETLQLAASTQGGSDSSYSWSSTFPSRASVDTNGLVTAHEVGRFNVAAEGSDTYAIGNIELVAYKDDDVIFTQPESGSQWISESVQTVMWDVVGTVSAGTLYYSVNGGTDWMDIGVKTNMNDGEYDWSVPVVTENKNDCLVKMEWAGGQSQSSTFSILPVSEPFSLLITTDIDYAGISFTGTIGQTYTVLYTDNLTNTTWNSIDTVIPTNTPCTWSDPAAPQKTRAFYKVTKP